MNNDFEKLFDTKYVLISWNDTLKDKDCFCANDIYTLRTNIITHDLHNWGKVEFNADDDFTPFKLNSENFIFCYYDKDYELKREKIIKEMEK